MLKECPGALVNKTLILFSLVLIFFFFSLFKWSKSNCNRQFSVKNWLPKGSIRDLTFSVVFKNSNKGSCIFQGVKQYFNLVLVGFQFYSSESFKNWHSLHSVIFILHSIDILYPFGFFHNILTIVDSGD